jgi:hypothetical protein
VTLFVQRSHFGQLWLVQFLLYHGDCLQGADALQVLLLLQSELLQFLELFPLLLLDSLENHFFLQFVKVSVVVVALSGFFSSGKSHRLNYLVEHVHLTHAEVLLVLFNLEVSSSGGESCLEV